MKSAIKYVLSSYNIIFIIFNETEIGLDSSLKFVKVIIWTVFSCIVKIDLGLVGYVLVQVILQYVKYGWIIYKAGFH